MITRAIRRHHRQRIKNKVKDYYTGWAGSTSRTLGIVSTTRVLCSDMCCGNPRRVKKWTCHKTLYDQDGNKTIVRETITIGRKNRLTKQEKIHTLDFELTAE